LVQTSESQVDDLRDIAFGCSRGNHSGSTEYWEEKQPPWTAFYFMTFEAWFAFVAFCADQGVTYSVPP
jgi:hypothetical protein